MASQKDGCVLYPGEGIDEMKGLPLPKVSEVDPHDETSLAEPVKEMTSEDNPSDMNYSVCLCRPRPKLTRKEKILRRFPYLGSRSDDCTNMRPKLMRLNPQRPQEELLLMASQKDGRVLSPGEDIDEMKDLPPPKVSEFDHHEETSLAEPVKEMTSEDNTRDRDHSVCLCCPRPKLTRKEKIPSRLPYVEPRSDDGTNMRAKMMRLNPQPFSKEEQVEEMQDEEDNSSGDSLSNIGWPLPERRFDTIEEQLKYAWERNRELMSKGYKNIPGSDDEPPEPTYSGVSDDYENELDEVWFNDPSRIYKLIGDDEEDHPGASEGSQDATSSEDS